jgi:hypothetical protein
MCLYYNNLFYFYKKCKVHSAPILDKGYGLLVSGYRPLVTGYWL